MSTEQQRDMFTNRWRKSKPPPPLEVRVHIALADTIDRFMDRMKWRCTHVPNGELRTKETAARLKRMGVQAGWPDFQFLSHEGRMYFLELKRPGNDLSEMQEHFHRWCLRWGIPCQVVSNYKDAVEALKAWGILPDRVHVQ